MKIRIAAKSDKGRSRRRNEDRATARLTRSRGEPAGILAVADGVGGAPAGATASTLAIRRVERWTLTGDPASDLEALFEAANHEIIADARRNSAHAGMATTLVVALITRGHLWVANVGDSRAYLVSSCEFRQITRDHSLVAERIRAGLIGEADAAVSPQRSIITRSLGQPDPLVVDVFCCGQLDAGDSVLLCSDGLYTMVRDEEIAEIARSPQPHKIVKDLVGKANQLGGYDNIAVAVGSLTGPAVTGSVGRANAH